MQLLPVLASSLEFGSAAAPALTVLLKMGAWLTPDQFNVKVCYAPCFITFNFTSWNLSQDRPN